LVPGSNPGGPTNKINTNLMLEKNTTELCYTLVHTKSLNCTNYLRIPLVLK